MYIRRTRIKSRQTGEPYYTYRLVESIREGAQVRQRTLLNLGRHFEVPREQWAALVQRIKQLLSGRPDLMPTTCQWLQEQSALGELIDYDFLDIDLMALYRISDQLLKHKGALDGFLYEQERTGANTRYPSQTAR